MAADIRLVDFKTTRLKKNAKLMLERTCDAIMDVDYNVAGFAVIAWDDTGSSALGFHTGGPVSMGGLSTYVSDKLRNVMQSVRIEEEST